MKKQYIQPESILLSIETDSMIATSEPPEFNGELGSRDTDIFENELFGEISIEGLATPLW